MSLLPTLRAFGLAGSLFCCLLAADDVLTVGIISFSIEVYAVGQKGRFVALNDA